MKTKQLAIDAVLAAMCAVLGYISIDLATLKFTFESFPIILASFLFGPIHGMLVAFVGIFISQMTKYGLEASTILWIIPYVVFALYMGLLYKEGMSKKVFILFMISGGLLLTLINTGSLCIYYRMLLEKPLGAVLVSVPTRLITNIIKFFVFALIVPGIIKAVKPYAA